MSQSKNLEVAVEMYEFINTTSRPYHLTIADIKKLKLGDELDVVIWDGNFEESDNIWGVVSTGTYDSWELFKGNRHKITHKEAPHGLGELEIHFGWGETILHYIDLNVTDFIKETYWTWAPVHEDGSIHITDEYLPRGRDKIPEGWKAKHINWTEFPETTRAGWRGPIMLWENLKKLPQVRYIEHYFPKDPKEE